MNGTGLAEQAWPSSPDGPPVQVLVVDDDDAKRLALKAALAPLGVSVVEADSGVAALRCVMAQDFALILLDVFMPIMDGFETAELIRQRKQSEMTPIIFITASKGDELSHVDRFAQGAVDFMFAPVNPGELRAKVSVFASLFINAEQLAAQARELQNAADHLRLLTDVAPIGIFQTDGQGRYVYTNPRWSELTGIPQDEAVGQELDTVIAAEHRFELTQQLAALSADSSEFSYRFTIPRADSPTRFAIITGVPIPSPHGGNAGMIGTIADVTTETEAEAAMSEARDAANSASQLKSDFLANMSHEIRTPMNGVIGMTDLLLETDLDARQRDYAQTVRNSGEALLTIINDILDFSKVEAGMLDIEAEIFRLRTVIDDVVDLLAGPAQAKGLELVASVQAAVPPEVRGDAGRLRQVLLNLVGNAVKFTEQGEVVIRATCEHEDPSGEVTLRFEVQDTGVGIPEDKIGAIFEPFVQADTSTSRRHGGTGLGLAISGQLVRLMGGDYGVSSEPTRGSTFWFTMQVRTAGVAATLGTGPHPDMFGLSALVVDDNTSVREALFDHLAEWGMKVTGVESAELGQASLRMAAEAGAPFAVALFDRGVPGLMGPGLKGAIVSEFATATPLVLMTGMGEDFGVGTAEAAGFCAVLTKPVHSDALLASIRIAMDLDTVAPRGASLPMPAAAIRSDGVKGRLLLAEDNLINQKVAVAMLSSAGYSIDTVFDGAAAVRANEMQQYDAILMDCQMPGMNGYEATEAIRAHEGSSRHTPIIALTAGARSEDRARCLSRGMDSYLSKPASKEALLGIVKSSIRRSSNPPTASVGGDSLRPVDEIERTASIPPGGCTPRGPDGDGSMGQVPDTVVGDGPDRGSPALDPTVLHELERLGAATGEDLVDQLFVQFFADADEHVIALHRAVADSDLDSLTRSAHTLTGSSANLGATELARRCGVIADVSGPGAVAHAQSALGEVESELSRVRTAFASRASTQ